MESAEIISPFTAFARATDRAVFPTAVGPVRMTRGGFEGALPALGAVLNVESDVGRTFSLFATLQAEGCIFP